MSITATSFVSFATAWETILPKIVADSDLHAKWLNTLSYLENCGARKIATCEHPTKVKKQVLKHAAEEFRHAHYLKSQIGKVSTLDLTDYSSHLMLGDFSTMHYLNALDIYICQYLKKQERYSLFAIREAAYILVTYAIELRASELYPIYHETLKSYKSTVAVKSILLEEEEHLAEMAQELSSIPDGERLLGLVCEFEARICQKWIHSLLKIV